MRARVACLLLVGLGGCGRVAFDDTHREPHADAAGDGADATPPEPPRFVQGANAQVTTNPQPLAFSKDTVAGDLIVVAVGALSMPTAVTDSQGHAFTSVIAVSNAQSRSFGYVWYAVAADGPDTVTVSYADATTHTIELLEYAQAGALDGKSSAAGSGKALDSGDLVTTTPGDLVLSFTHQPTATTWTAPAPFVVREDNHHTLVADEIVGAAGAYRATLTSAAAQPWDLHAIAFRPLGAR